MDEEFPIEYSRHCQKLTVDEHTIDVQIYRGTEPPSGWLLEGLK